MDTKDIARAQRIPFEFSGKAGEYFKIWIVNILLTILTLGIYSAWAKVRRKRYFYGNTHLKDSTFEYHAQPVQILKGRLIAFGALVVYAAVEAMLPLAAAVLAILFVFAVPWLVIKAHAFNARNSSYRNLRLNFKGDYARALGVYIGLPILSVITLGLAYPAYMYHRAKFVVANSAYGTAPFTFTATAGGFYLIALKAILMVIAAGVVLVGLIQVFGSISASGIGGIGIWQLIILGGILIFPMIRAYVDTAVANLVWSNVSASNNQFQSTLRTRYMLWLYLSNAVAIVLSLGLLSPWAQIRTMRYRLENLTLLAKDDLDRFVARQQDKVDAAGEEVSEFFDLDIGI
ncbi:MAG: YjgN family protein [Acidiferrobacterales bacterium]